MKDRVMHPTNKSRAGGTAKGPKSAIIEGPSPSASNMNASYKGKKK